MVTVSDVRDPQLTDSPAPAPRSISYVSGPSLLEVLAGAELSLGHRGDAVSTLQERLNALGAQPPLEVDGKFGPLTQGALRDFQGRAGVPQNGALGTEMWMLIEMVLQGRRDDCPGGQGGRGANTPARAPRFGERAPAGTMSAGQLARSDDARMRTRGGSQPAPANGATGANGASNEAGIAPPMQTGPVNPAAGQTRGDAELERLQQATIASAQRELAAGVHEDLGDNRGRRIDEYARDGRMGVGYEWCGFFTGFNYNQAAREAGGRFTENVRFHSMQKARSYFEYRTFTNGSRAENDRLDRLREQHTADGSTRRWMVLNGSGGETHARQNNRPYEAFEPRDLPIRTGDTALFSRGHVGLVESYDRASGRLTTIEGNAGGGRVRRREYNLNNASDRAAFEGFGRPARGDFDVPGVPGANAPAQPAETQPTQTAPQQTAPTQTAPQQTAPTQTAPTQTAPQQTAPQQTAPTQTAAPSSGATLNLPARDPNAMTGSQFIAKTANMSRAEREQWIRYEIERGNVPDFARQMRELDVSANGHTGKVRVMPDYLAIGSNEDFVRIPMDANTAQAIADQTGTVLPTRRLVDEVYRQADVRLTPQPMPAGAQMMSNDYYARHNAMVEAQRNQRGAQLGALTAGHQKDLVITNLLDQRADRVAIYGWHQQNGRPIQPLSTIHEETYADYSHGVRLVGGTMVVDGVERPIAEVLRDPALAGLISDEGVIRNPRANR